VYTQSDWNREHRIEDFSMERGVKTFAAEKTETFTFVPTAYELSYSMPVDDVEPPGSLNLPASRPIYGPWISTTTETAQHVWLGAMMWMWHQALIEEGVDVYKRWQVKVVVEYKDIRTDTLPQGIHPAVTHGTDPEEVEIDGIENSITSMYPSDATEAEYGMSSLYMSTLNNAAGWTDGVSWRPSMEP